MIDINEAFKSDSGSAADLNEIERLNEIEQPHIRKYLAAWKESARGWDRQALFMALWGVLSAAAAAEIALSLFANDPMLESAISLRQFFTVMLLSLTATLCAWSAFVFCPPRKALAVKNYYKCQFELDAIDRGLFWAAAANEFDRAFKESDFLNEYID